MQVGRSIASPPPEEVLTCPFPEDAQLHPTAQEWKDKDGLLPRVDLPGFPGLYIDDSPTLYDHLERDLCSEDLDRLAPRMWMLTTQSSSNISALHHQRVKARKIVVAEAPKLHLAWAGDTIFIKPLPRYLLAAPFWTDLLPRSPPALRTRRDRIRGWALGFLRTYAHLIAHESDLRVALAEGLVPADTTWAGWRRFAARLRAIEDREVAPRYAHGELRLARLNLHAKLFLRRPAVLRQYRQYGTYFAQFYGPLLFVFAAFSVMMSAMQLATSTKALPDGESKGLAPGFWWVCHWFGVATLGLVWLLCLVLVAIGGYKFCREWSRAIRDRYRLVWKRRSRERMASSV